MTAPIEQRAVKLVRALEADGRIVRGLEIEGRTIKLTLADEAKPASAVDLIDWRRKAK